LSPFQGISELKKGIRIPRFSASRLRPGYFSRPIGALKGKPGMAC
jgi:hypothetical protein